jgi:hypothetical protein
MVNRSVGDLEGLKEEENLFKNNLIEAGGSMNYLNIKENYVMSVDNINNSNINIENEYNDYKTLKHAHTYNTNEYDRYQNYNTNQTLNSEKNSPLNTSLAKLKTNSKQLSPLRSINENDAKFLKSKLETKKLRLRELKKQFENVCEENANLKYKIQELQNYKHTVGDKIEMYEKENKYNDIKYAEREREMINIIRQLEHDVNN